MILNTRILIVFLLFSVEIFAQKNDSIPAYQYSPNDPETVFFDLEGFYPIALGNTVYRDAYNFDAGFAINFNWFFKPNFTLGARLSQVTGHPEDKSLTGNIKYTNFQLLGLTFGYFHPFDRDWSLQSKIGIGTTNYRNRSPEDRFEDKGGQLWLAEEVSYRLGKSFAVFATTGLEYHFNHIDIVPAKKDYFNTAFFANLGIGLRWHLQNPGG